jgi:hypothetical protein
MGLKFRRGSTAQQSGSLAFGEPYVNTTLGTLVIGGATGDIVLSAGGTGSTGNFGAISGSGLDITGNANIAGNLTLGGAITIGDASADTVNVVASLSSSLIPQTTNAFDLGSATKIWRDLYISTGSIKFVEGNTVVKSLNAATLTALEVATGSSNVSVAALNSFSSSQLTQNTALATISGSLISSASANTISVANLNAASSSYETKGRSIVSGSSQITYASISSIPAGIVSGSSQVTPLLPTGVVSGSAQTIVNLPTGTISGSSQVTYASISSIPVGIISGSSQLSGTSITDLTIINLTTVNQTASVVFSSGSNRFGDFGDDIHSFTGSVKISGSIATIGASTATSFNGIINATNGVVSGSSQITYASISSIPAGIVSGAAQVTPLLPTGTISGSSQVVGSSITTNTITIGSTSTALGGTSTTLAGLTSVTSTAFVGALTGNASTATTLATSRAINGVNFDGSAAITVTAAAGTLSGATLSSGVTASSLTSVGTLGTLTVSGATATGALTVTGAVTATGDITAFFTSDKRHKNNIQTISNAVLKVKQLNGVTWEWNDDVNEVTKTTPKTGLIAQEVQQVLPQVVIERADGFLALDYSKMVGLLVEAIKEQQIQIDQLKAQIGSK